MKSFRTKFAIFTIAALISIPTLLASQLPAQSDNQVQGGQKDLVVLIHGLGRSNAAMSGLAEQLEAAGFAVRRVGYSSFSTTPEEMIEEVAEQINDLNITPDQSIHFVGHSLGGLMIRAYLDEHKPEQLGNTVLVGTPNQGTEIADRYKGNHWIEWLMPTALALGTDAQSLPNQLPAPYYPVGIIAGINERENTKELLTGVNDGLVTVESTKLEGMTDFIEVQTGHSMMRYDSQVAEQVVAFLNNGQFDHRVNH